MSRSRREISLFARLSDVAAVELASMIWSQVRVREWSDPTVTGFHAINWRSSGPPGSSRYREYRRRRNQALPVCVGDDHNGPPV